MSNTPDILLDDLLVRHAMGEILSPEEKQLLDAALARDPAQRAQWRSLHETMGLLAQSVSAAPPAALRARVLATAAAPRSVTRRWLPVAMAASIALLASATSLMLWIENQGLRRGREQQAAAARMLLEPNVVQSFELRGSGAAAQATALVMLDLDAQRASISAQGLPQLPTGQAYFLWAELEDRKVPCGRFVAQSDGSALTQFRIPVNAYVSPIRRLILTVEPDQDSPTPAGEIVMSS